MKILKTVITILICIFVSNSGAASHKEPHAVQGNMTLFGIKLFLTVFRICCHIFDVIQSDVMLQKQVH